LVKGIANKIIEKDPVIKRKIIINITSKFYKRTAMEVEIEG